MKNIAYKVGCVSSVLLLLALTFAGGVLADGGEEGEGEMQIVNGYHITLVWMNPVQLGENPFHLQVSDAQAQPVTHAAIAVSLLAREAEPAVEHDDAGHGETDTDNNAHGSASDSSAHSGMDMSGDTDAHSDTHQVMLEPGGENGEYVGKIVITQAGTWLVRAHLTIDALPLEVNFPVTVVAPTSSGRNILTGFFALNAVILGAAAVLRSRKPVKAQSA